MEEPTRLMDRGKRDEWDRHVDSQPGSDYEEKLAYTAGKSRYLELFGIDVDEAVSILAAPDDNESVDDNA